MLVRTKVRCLGLSAAYNNDKLSVAAKAGSLEGSVYADLISSLRRWRGSSNEHQSRKKNTKVKMTGKMIGKT